MKNSERGSALILVLIAVLILSLIGLAGLENTSLETKTNRQFLADKTALYTAESGISDGIRRIYNEYYPPDIVFPKVPFGQMSYRGGALNETPAVPVKAVKAFLGFKAPPPTGMSIEMSSEMGATIVLWDLTVSASVEGTPSAGNKNLRSARKELQSIVAAFAPEY